MKCFQANPSTVICQIIKLRTFNELKSHYLKKKFLKKTFFFLFCMLLYHLPSRFFNLQINTTAFAEKKNHLQFL